MGAAPAPGPIPAPFLWELTRPGFAPSYLCGTIHLPSPAWASLNPLIEAALQRAEGGFFGELDLADQGKLQAAMAQYLFLPSEAKGLRAGLGEESWTVLEALSARRGLPASGFERMRPEIVSMLLIMGGAQGAGAGALDQVLFQRAAALGRPTAGIEQPEEQLQELFALPLPEAMEILRELLPVLARLDEASLDLLSVLKASYLSGDEGFALAVIELEEESSAANRRLMKGLLERRDAVMSERALKVMERAPQRSFFFAFGLAHFIGEKSVRSRLEAAGFKSRRLGLPATQTAETRALMRQVKEIIASAKDQPPAERDKVSPAPALSP